MRMRWISTHIRPASLGLAFALTAFGLTVRGGHRRTDPVCLGRPGSFGTWHNSVPGTEGTFDQGTRANPFAFVVGRFVVDQSTSISEIDLSPRRVHDHDPGPRPYRGGRWRRPGCR